MNKMECIKKNNLTSSLLCASVALILGCTGNRQIAVNSLNVEFKNVLDSISLFDYTSILNQKKDDLLFATSFCQDTFKVLLIEKHLYPKYLYYFPELSKPYSACKYKNVLVLGYSQELPSAYNTKQLPNRPSYLIPYSIPAPTEGNIPYPPPSIEPLIYTYLLRGGTYTLIRKSLSDSLFCGK